MFSLNQPKRILSLITLMNSLPESTSTNHQDSPFERC
uniref:Uncharacterized protein n=1 Tax=Rhizophora mucronata TaxID=61149 RepID=A0A2P2NIY7_RHIMU